MLNKHQFMNPKTGQSITKNQNNQSSNNTASSAGLIQPSAVQQPDWVKIDDNITTAIDKLKEIIVHESCENDVHVIMEALQSAFAVIHPTAEKIRAKKQIETLQRQIGNLEKKIDELTVSEVLNKPTAIPNKNGRIYPGDEFKKELERWVKAGKSVQVSHSSGDVYQTIVDAHDAYCSAVDTHYYNDDDEYNW